MRTGSSVASLPNPTPLLFLFTAVVLLVWPDAMGVTALAVFGAIAVPAALVFMVRSPQVAMIALIAASAVPRVFVEVAGLKARPEHIIAGLMIFTIPFLLKKREQPVRWILADYLLLAYIATIFFSSVFMSVAPGQTAKWAVQQALAILPYFWLRVLVKDWASFRWAFRALLVVGVVTCTYAILSFYSYIFLGTKFGVEVEQYGVEGGGNIAATYGLQFEANILGAYGAALFTMMLVMYLHERRRWYLFGGIFCGMVTMAVSLSRAALGAAIVGCLLVALIAWRRRLLQGKVVLKIAAAVCAAILLVGPFVFKHYTERFSSVDIEDITADPNTLTRAVQTLSALDEVEKHPIFGGGVSSFQLAFNWQTFGADWQDQGWIGNTELRVLHDTGAVGLLVFFGFLFSLARQSVKQLKRRFSPELLALLCSGVVYSITFQATEGTLLAFPWVQLGLISCAVSVLHDQQKEEKPPEFAAI
jgi:O-antigen ligase